MDSEEKKIEKGHGDPFKSSFLIIECGALGDSYIDIHVEEDSEADPEEDTSNFQPSSTDNQDLPSSDILFAVLCLSWFTYKPRQHHLSMAYYCIGYLYTTMDLPLVLGGTSPLTLFGWTDASLGTGPRRRSVLGNISTLGPNSGAIQAKATTSTATCLSSFEAKLDGLTTMLKTLDISSANYFPISLLKATSSPKMKLYLTSSTPTHPSLKACAMSKCDLTLRAILYLRGNSNKNM
jgi:hypothetical protein